jgi:hypothetical protein
LHSFEFIWACHLSSPSSTAVLRPENGFSWEQVGLRAIRVEGRASLRPLALATLIDMGQPWMSRRHCCRARGVQACCWTHSATKNVECVRSGEHPQSARTMKAPRCRLAHEERTENWVGTGSARRCAVRMIAASNAVSPTLFHLVGPLQETTQPMKQRPGIKQSYYWPK